MDSFSPPLVGETNRDEHSDFSPVEFSGAQAVEVVESYFNAEGRPIKSKSLGAARVARSYDKRGNQIGEAYYGANGKPTPRKGGLGAARIHWRYDESGRKIEAAFFDADGLLLARENAGGRGDQPKQKL